MLKCSTKFGERDQRRTSCSESLRWSAKHDPKFPAPSTQTRDFGGENWRSLANGAIVDEFESNAVLSVNVNFLVPHSDQVVRWRR